MKTAVGVNDCLSINIRGSEFEKQRDISALVFSES